MRGDNKDETYEFRNIPFLKESKNQPGAILCRFGALERWIPKSLIADSRYDPDRRCFTTISISLFFVERERCVAAYEASHGIPDPPSPAAPPPEPPQVVYDFMTDINELVQAYKQDAAEQGVTELPRGNAVFRSLVKKYHPDLMAAAQA